MIRKVLLFPVTILYSIGVFGRNLAFDMGWWKASKSPIPTICIGNLSMGGTGKSPLTNWLIEYFVPNHNVQVLSRGYGRKTKGPLLFHKELTAEDVGDEPFMYALKHGERIDLAVAEKRWKGFSLLPIKENRMLLLDDAFQHRWLTANVNIVVTTFQKPFYNDALFPMGTLREPISGLKRATAVLVSKCPDNASEKDKKEIATAIQRIADRPVFFSYYKYKSPVSFGKVPVFEADKILLVTGIADPTPMIEHLSKTHEVELLRFPDHHRFTASEIQGVHRKFDTFANHNKAILTTEKDFARLWHHLNDWNLKLYPWFYLPIELVIENEIEFKALINSKL
jgi:tetraacyldisaccharide 4'-kinase